MPVQTNQPPYPQGGYPAVTTNMPNPAWLKQDESDFDLAQFLRVVRRRGLIIVGVSVAVASAIWGWTLTRTPIYRGEFRVLIESVDETDRSQELLLQEQLQLGTTVDYDTQIEVLLSPVLLEPISRELRDEYPELTPSAIASSLSINRLRDTKVLEVSYRGSNPQRIQAVLEEVAQQYLDYSFDQRQASLSQGIQFVDDQLPELRERVNNLQIRLERFRQQYSLLDPENRGADLSGLISQVEEQRQQLQTELSQARSLYRSLQGQLRVSPEEALAAAALSESPRYQSLLNQIQELEAQIAVESAKYQPGSPQLEVLQERRDNLVSLLEAEADDVLGDRFAVGPSDRVDGNLTPTSIDLGRQLIRAANDVQMLQARSQTLAQVEQDLKQEFDLVPALARQYADLQRELTVATDSLNRFLTTRETLQIDAAQKSVPWQLISEPATSRVPISPNIPRNLMLGAVTGLLMGGIAALLAEKLDQVYHSPDELKSATQLPLLGIVPFYPALQEEQRIEEVTQDAQLNGAAPASNQLPQSSASGSRQRTFQSAMFLEAFRSLYTNIRFLGTDEPIHSLVVSSAIPSEGKSTVALYMARAAAVMGQRVLLVDADLRSPKYHTRLNLANIRGLSNLISDGLRVQDVVQRSPLDDNLYVVTAGPVPPDPVKLLSSRRMQTIIEQVQSDYDLVVFDMPPTIGFADSALVATHTDGLMLVVGLGKTEKQAVIRALEEIRLSPVSVLGIVANGIKAHTTQIQDSYRYYRYYSKTQHAGSRTRSVAIAPGTFSGSPSSPASPGDDTADLGNPNLGDPGLGDPNLGDPTEGPMPHPSSRFGPGAPPDAGEPRHQGWQYREQASDRSSGASGTPGTDADDVAYGRFGNNDTTASGSAAGSGADHPPISTFARQRASTHEPTTATVHTSSPFAHLSFWQKAVTGVAAAALLGIVGWTLYSRFIEGNDPSDVIPPYSEEDPTVVDPVETPEFGGDEPLTDSEIQDPFAEAVYIAQEAVAAGETARTSEEWSAIAEQWQRASGLMAIVPPTDERFAIARDRTVLYRNNGEFARQKVLELLRAENLGDLDTDESE